VSTAAPLPNHAADQTILLAVILWVIMRPRPDRSNLKFPNGTPEGVTLSTQSGPYDNSFPNKNAPAHTTWLSTYFPDEEEKKTRRRH